MSKKTQEASKSMDRIVGGGRRNGCSLEGDILASTLRVALKGVDQNMTVNFETLEDGNTVRVWLTNADGKVMPFPAQDE